MNVVSPASPPSMSPGEGWTVATYAAHNEALRQAEEKFQAERDRRYSEVASLKDNALREALDKAQAALDIRLERMNEFREQITDERTQYIRKDQYDAEIRSLRADVRQMQDKDTKGEGQNLGLMGIGLAAVGSLIVSLFNFLLRG